MYFRPRLRVSDVAEAFLTLAQSDVSGRAMFITHKYTGLVDFPVTVEEIIEKYT